MKLESQGLTIEIIFEDGFPIVEICTNGGWMNEKDRPAVEVKLNDVTIHEMFEAEDYTPMRNPRNLSKDELVGIVTRVQDLLWLDDEQGDIWNPDKQWDSGTIEAVSKALDEAGLRPETKKRA